MNTANPLHPMNLITSPAMMWFPGNMYHHALVDEKDPPHAEISSSVPMPELLVLFGGLLLISLFALILSHKK